MCVQSTTTYRRQHWYRFYSILKKQPQCIGCGVTYPYLKGLLCGTCLNRSETGMCLYANRVIHGSQLQLESCEDPSIFDGTLFIFNHLMFCQWPCELEGHAPIVNLLAKRVKDFEGLASEHRLNQRPQNSSLQSAEKVKEKIAILKKQVKSDWCQRSVVDISRGQKHGTQGIKFPMTRTSGDVL